MSSSNAVVVPTKNNALQQKQVESESGFFEEDEAEECQAALLSPIKGRQ